MDNSRGLGGGRPRSRGGRDRRRGGSPSPLPEERARGKSPRQERSRRASSTKRARSYPPGRAPRDRLPEPGVPRDAEVTKEQPLANFSDSDQVVLENFYAKYEPKKKASEIQAELAEASSFDQLCSELEKKYKALQGQQKDGAKEPGSFHPLVMWSLDNHGREVDTASWRDRKHKAAERKAKAMKKAPSKKVARELRIEAAKRNMRAANYDASARIGAVTKSAIDDMLRKNGFHDGINYATPDQIKRAKRQIMLGPSAGNNDRWVDEMFRKKDRDGSMSLSFDEFRAMIRRYGKVPPRGATGVTDEDLREVFAHVDKSYDGEIQIDEFKDFLNDAPSKEMQEYNRKLANAGESRNLRVKELARDDIKRLWRKWDGNHSGVLSLAEVDKAMKYDPPPGWKGFDTRMASKALILAFNYADDDWSGEVGWSEFEGLLKNILYFNMLLDWYAELDDSGDGRLDMTEFKDSARDIGGRSMSSRARAIAGYSDSQLEREFEKIDEDAGGFVMFDEFAKWIGETEDPERADWKDLIGAFRAKDGVTDLRRMRIAIPDKHNKIVERFAPKITEFELDTLKSEFTKNPVEGWEGFENLQAIALAFKAADPDNDGGVGRDRLSKLLKYIVYFHVLSEQLADTDEETCLWLARTECRGVDWSEMEAWLAKHQAAAASGGRSNRRARKGRSPSPQRPASAAAEQGPARAERGGRGAARRGRKDRRSPSPERGEDTARGRDRARKPEPEPEPAPEPAPARRVAPSPRSPVKDAPARRTPTKKRGSKKDARAGGSDPAEALEDSLNNRLEAPFVEEEWDEKWSNDKVNSRDREGEAKTIELAQLLAQKRVEFTDRYFVAGDEALYSDPAQAGANAKKKGSFRKDTDAFLTGITGIEWKRPHEMYGGICADERPAAFVGDIDPEDVAQGNLGNCYFLAAIAALATQGRDDTELEDVLIKDLIVEEGAAQGLYGVKFYINGRWRTVVIDDLLPCTQDGRGEWRPIFAQRPADRKEFELWPMLFEKAWAKLHGSYEATAGGWTDDAMNYLTGGVCRTIDFHSEDAEASDCKAEWAELVELTADQGDFPLFLSCTLNNDADKDKMESEGLITGHAYSVMEAVEAKGEKVICLRNPWGAFEWNGKFSDGSKEFDRIRDELKRQVADDLVDGADDGSFWMGFDDFKTYFWEVGVCDPWELGVLSEVSPDGAGMDVEIDAARGEWVQGVSAGGMKDSRTFSHNPTFDLTAAGEEISIALYQMDTRRPGGLYAGIGEGHRKRRPPKAPPPTNFQKMTAYLVEADRPDVVREVVSLESHQRQAAARMATTPNKRYKVIVSTWAPAIEGKFCECSLETTHDSVPLLLSWAFCFLCQG